MSPLELLRNIRDTGPTVTATERLVLVALVLRIENKTGRCGRYAPALATLAEDTGLHRRTTRRTGLALAAKGLIVIHHGGVGRTNDYEVIPATLRQHQRLLPGAATGSAEVGQTIRGARTPAPPSYTTSTTTPQNTTEEPPETIDVVLWMIRTRQTTPPTLRAPFKRVAAQCKSHREPPGQGWRLHSVDAAALILERALREAGGYAEARAGTASPSQFNLSLKRQIEESAT